MHQMTFVQGQGLFSIRFWWQQSTRKNEIEWIRLFQVEELLLLKQWFSTSVDFAPPGDISNVWKHLWLSQLGD